MVPKELKGLTVWELPFGSNQIRYSPISGSGIFSAFVLALGRALGETMAVTILIGKFQRNSNLYFRH